MSPSLSDGHHTPPGSEALVWSISVLIHSSVLTEMEHVAAQIQRPQLRVEIQDGWQKQITPESIWDGKEKANKQKALHLYSAISQYFSARLTRYQGVYSCYYSRQKIFSVRMSDTS